MTGDGKRDAIQGGTEQLVALHSEWYAIYRDVIRDIRA